MKMSSSSQSEKDGVIYMFTCRENGKKYIGQTWDIVERIRCHKRAKGDIRLFHRAIKKYGFDSFDFEILQSGIDTQAYLDLVEWLEIRQKNTLIPNGYNLVEGGVGGNMSNEVKKVLSQNAKKRFSDPDERARMSEKIRQFHADPERGKAHKEKIRKAWESNAGYRQRVLDAAKRRKNDPEWIAKQTEMLKKRSKPVICIETGKIYESMGAAVAEYGITQSAISANIRGRTHLSAGYHWQFVDAACGG